MPTSKAHGPQPIITDQIIVPCEVGGGFQVGWWDDAPSFPSRQFALAVVNANQHRSHPASATTEVGMDTMLASPHRK